MSQMKTKIITLAGTLLYGLLFFAVYIFNHSVPLTDIYLGTDRTTHVWVVFVFGLTGAIIYSLLKKLNAPKIVKNTGLAFSFIFVFGIPALLFVRQCQSFRGVEWAIETFFIGMIPILFFYAFFLVLFNNRTVHLLLACFFGFFSMYHLLLMLRVFRSVGRAFSSTGTSDVVIMVLLIITGAFFAFFSMKRYLSLGK